MELPGERRSGRPKQRFMDAVREDMQVAGVSDEEAENSSRWKQTIHCGDP